jgi:PAS domain S-box-containing protein
MSDGLGFNRAILFLVDEERNVLKGEMGVGPADTEEAAKVWQSLTMEGKSLEQLMEEIERGPLRKDSFLDRLGTSIEINIEDNGYAVHRAIKEKTPVVVKNAKEDPSADPVIVQVLGSESYAFVPLVSRDRVIGLLWVDNYFTGRPITDDDIRFLTGFAGHVASAIENARLFEQVRRAEIELENIFESISDMLYITDEDYTIKHINRAVIERIGRAKEEIVGNKCYRIFHGTEEPYEKCPHHLTVQTKTAQMKEVEDPQSGHISLSSTSPIFDHEGRFMGTVHIVRDITEFKELEKRLAQAERMAALGEVAAKVAHEIRNPLVSIGGFAKRLEKKLDGKYKEYASIITREVNRLEGILKEILSFVRHTRLKKEKLELVNLINDIISLYRDELKSKSVQLKTQFDDPVLVEVDPDRLKEALINIIQNAIYVLPEGGKVSIRTYRKAQNGVIEISDNGPGIEEKDLPFIFDPFFTTKAEGTGLGLAITNRIIQEHGGTIEARSRINEGTTFIIKLPLAEEQKGGES